MVAAALARGLAVLTAAALLAGLPTLPASAAGGGISGNVSGPDGAPAAGVCVRAKTFGYGGTVASATTAADGSYRLTSVPAGTVQLVLDPCATAGDAAPQWYRQRLRLEDALGVEVRDGAETVGVSTTLAQGAAITGTVTDPSGTPLAGACVSAEPDNQANTYAFDRRSTTTAADGSYRLDRLPALGFRVVVDGCSRFGRTYAPSTGDRTAARVVTSQAGAVLAGVDVRMQEPGAVSGRLLGPGGEPLPGRCLSLYDSGTSLYAIRGTITASDGTWRLAELASGSYRLSVEDCRTGLHLTRWYDGSAWVDSDRSTFSLQAGEQRGTPDLVASAAGAVSGTIVDDTGAPVTARPCAYAYADGAQQSFLPAVQVYESGRYTVGGLPAGRYRVSVGTCRIGDYGSVWVGGDDRRATARLVEVVAGRVSAQDVVRPRVGFLTGTVRDDLGQPARGCVIFGGFAIARSGADGTYTSPPLYPRERTVGFAGSCVTPDASGSYPAESTTTATMAPTQTTGAIDGVIASALSLSGTVRDPAGDPVPACVTVTAVGQPTRETTAAPTGAWRLDGMQPGDWTIGFRLCGPSAANLMPTWYPGVPTLAEAVPVPLGSAAVSGIDTVMRTGARITGTVTGPDGLPIKSACLWLSDAATGRSVDGQGQVTDADGRYDLRAVPPGTYRLMAQVCAQGRDVGEPAPTYWPGDTTRRKEAQARVLQVGDNGPADIQMLTGGAVTGRITDTAGGAVPACLSLRSTEPWNRYARTDADGRYSVNGLGTADRAELRVTDCGVGERATLTLQLGGVQAGQSRDAGTTALPLAASISGTLRRDVTGEAAGGVCVATSSPDGTYHEVTSGPDGRYSLRGLAPGSYVLRFNDCSGRSFVVTEYYRDAAGQDSATPVQVAEDEDRTGVDASLLTVTVPSVPRNVRAVRSTSGATVSWEEPAQDGHAHIESYVLRDTATGSVLATIEGWKRTAQLGGTPVVTVEAVNRRGAGPASAPLKTADGEQPAEPPPAPAPSAEPAPAPAPQPSPSESETPAPSPSAGPAPNAGPGAGSGTGAGSGDHAVAPGLQPLPPARVLDTRTGNGVAGRLPAGRPVRLPVLGRGGVPTTRVSAVLINATATGASAPGHLTVFPGGAPPVASTLNYGRGGAVAGLALVPVASDGTISLVANTGTPHAVADVVGFVEHSPTPALVPLPPARVLDTRTGNGFSGRLQPAAKRLPVLGRGGVPRDGVDAVVVTTTVTGASASGFLTAFPGGKAPLASTLNFTRGQTVANLAVVPVGADGTISLLANAGAPHGIVDVVGYVASSPLPDLRPLPPSRILDSRNSTGLDERLAAAPVDVAVTGRGGVPLVGVRAVLLNVTATGASASGFLTAYASGDPVPVASTLNFTRGQTVANLALVPVSRDGRISLFANAGAPHVVADVVGWIGA